MPVPNFRETFSGNIAPGVTIFSEGDYFDDEENLGVDVATMNQELADRKEVVFLDPDPQTEDGPLKFFLNSQNALI